MSPVRAVLTVVASALIGAVPLFADPFGTVAHIPTQPIVDEIKELGTDWARIDFVWALVESEHGRFDWTIYDDLVDRLETAELKVFATLQGTPQWATGGSAFSGVPSSPADWQDFCYRAAARYRGRVHAWGLWNEPNLYHFWEGSRDEYINMILVRGATAIRAADPGALVGGPELAHLNSRQWDTWLDDVIKRAGDYFDLVTHHVYPSGHDASDVTTKLDRDSPYPWEPPSVRTVLNRAGWGNRPVWLTETGLQSEANGEVSQHFFYVDLLDDWFDDGQSRRWLDRIFFYETADSEDYPEFTWGLLGPPPELRRKPAFSAYKNFISSARIDDCEIVSADVPEFFRSAQQQELLIVLKNTGGTSWTSDSHRLHAETNVRNWRFSGGGLPESVTVAPGDEIAVSIQVRAPYTSFFGSPAAAPVVVRMERADQWFFGEGLSRIFYLTNFEPPELLMHPRSVVADLGDAISFTVVVSSPSPASYSWRRNSIELTEGPVYEGTEGPVLRIHRANAGTVADYDCVVSNSAGRVISRIATLRLGDATGPSTTGRRATGRVGAGAKLLDAWRAFRQSGPKIDPIQTPD